MNKVVLDIECVLFLVLLTWIIAWKTRGEASHSPNQTVEGFRILASLTSLSFAVWQRLSNLI